LKTIFESCAIGKLFRKSLQREEAWSHLKLYENDPLSQPQNVS
jgi:hypothetical protein